MSQERLPIAHLQFVIATGNSILLPKAFSATDDSPLEQVNLAYVRPQKLLRAICILLLLAKHRGEDFAHFRFTTERQAKTWIRTLGNSKNNQKDVDNFFSLDLKVPQFFKASRTGKPYASLIVEVLPFRNIDLRKAGDEGRELTRDELAQMARTLEQEFVERKEWEVAIVPEFLTTI